MEENRRQGVIKDRQRWCEYIEKAVWPRKAKAQQKTTGHQKNIQNAKRSVDEYWSRKVRYA